MVHAMLKVGLVLAVVATCSRSASAAPADRPVGAERAERSLAPPFAWRLSAPLVAPVERPEDPCVSVKDPTVVLHNGRWHVFATIRSKVRTHQIEYFSFADWSEANRAERHILKVTDGYFCAPQVFYYTPMKKWVLLYQVANPDRTPNLQPAVSFNDDVANPAGWTKPQTLFGAGPDNVKHWIDFWIICDDTHARLFATANDGRMFRSDAKLADVPPGEFPRQWSAPQVVLTADIFEASHTYKVRGRQQYLTVIEAQGRPDGGSRPRYYKLYESDRLDGEWKPVADTEAAPFAGKANVKPGEPASGLWTENISHGELLRAGIDERMEIEPANLRFLIQGVLEKDKKGKAYGDIPWRLGLLEMEEKTKP